MATSAISNSNSSSPTLPRSPSQEALVTKVAQENIPKKTFEDNKYSFNGKLAEAQELLKSEKYNEARDLFYEIQVEKRKTNLPIESTISIVCKIGLAHGSTHNGNIRDNWTLAALGEIRFIFLQKDSWDQSAENIFKTYQECHKYLLEIQQLSSDSKITSENQKQIKDTIQECETELEKLQPTNKKKVTPGGDDSGRFGRIFIAVVLGALAVVAVAVLYRRHIVKNSS